MSPEPKRRAFVGFSSPLAYDYVNNASHAQADRYSSPNPILDSPFGLMILFDEIVFLTRSLCPENMRHLPFVRFLDEEGFTPKDANLEWHRVQALLEDDPQWRELVRHEKRNQPDYGETLRAAGVAWTGVDNHTHGLGIGQLEISGNATLFNLVRDFLLLEQIGDPQLELVTNSLTQPYLEPRPTPLPSAQLAERLIVRNIHNYLSTEGPYHPSIDEARENSFLIDFRRWMVEEHSHLQASEVSDVQESVENALQDLQDRVFLKHLGGKWSHYLSVGKAAIGDGIGAVIPGAGVVVAVAEEALKHRQRKDQRWAGFVVGARKGMRPNPS